MCPSQMFGWWKFLLHCHSILYVLGGGLKGQYIVKNVWGGYTINPHVSVHLEFRLQPPPHGHPSTHVPGPRGVPQNYCHKHLMLWTILLMAASFAGTLIGPCPPYSVVTLFMYVTVKSMAKLVAYSILMHNILTSKTLRLLLQLLSNGYFSLLH